MSSALLLGVSTGDLLFLTFIFLPSFITFLFPLSFYLSTYAVASRMAVDKEIIVLEGLGFKLKRLYIPFALLSILVITFLSINLFFIEPFFFKKAMGKVEKIWEKRGLFINKDTFVDIFKDSVLYIGGKDGGVFKDVFIQRKEEGREYIIIAEEGRLVNKGYGEYNMILKRGHMEIRGSNKGISIIGFDEMNMSFVISSKFLPKKLFMLKDKEMDILTLKRKINELKSRDAERALTLEKIYYLKLSLVLSVIPLSLIGFCVGCGRTFISGLKGSLLFLVLFYGFFTLTHRIDTLPFLSFLPCAIFTVVGFLLFVFLKE